MEKDIVMNGAVMKTVTIETMHREITTGQRIELT
jgi:hypothetical protein